MTFNALNFTNNLPKGFQDLKFRYDKRVWLDFMNRELESIVENKTWLEVERPNNVKILDKKHIVHTKT